MIGLSTRRPAGCDRSRRSGAQPLSTPAILMAGDGIAALGDAAWRLAPEGSGEVQGDVRETRGIAPA
jgi:hypothetical protein